MVSPGSMDLSGVQANELITFPSGVTGMALNLEEESVGAIILGAYNDIKEGDEVRSTGRIAEVPVGDALIGRVVNPPWVNRSTAGARSAPTRPDL